MGQSFLRRLQFSLNYLTVVNVLCYLLVRVDKIRFYAQKCDERLTDSSACESWSVLSLKYFTYQELFYLSGTLTAATTAFFVLSPSEAVGWGTLSSITSFAITSLTDSCICFLERAESLW